MNRHSARALLFATVLVNAAAGNLSTQNCAMAQDADQAGTSQNANTGKKSKASPKYEEYYEKVPADDNDPASGGSAVTGSGLDPEGDASPPPSAASSAPASAPATQPRTLGNHKSAAPAPVRRAEPKETDSAPAAEAAKTDETAPASDNEAKKAKSSANSEQDNGSANANAQSARGAPPPTETGLGEDVSDLSYFREVLTKGGAWRSHARYGEVFVPEVPDGWRPYTLGHWVYSDAYGWTWISDEVFGWATYHYGRWTREDANGWMWIPGGEWGPSWVVWRQTNDAIGWAALPPSATFVNDRLSLDANAIDNDGFVKSWAFVNPRYFARIQMTRFLRPVSWNSDLVDRSQPRLGYERDADTGHILNRGIPPDEVEKLAGLPVPRTTVTPVDDPRAIESARAHQLDIRKGEVKIYRPASKRVEQALKKPSGSKKRAEGGTASSKTSRAEEAKTTSASKSAAPQADKAAAQAGAEKSEQAASVKKKTEPSPTSSATATAKDKADEPKEASSAKSSEASGSATATGSIPASKRRWDASGPSGAPAPATSEQPSSGDP
ncbi:MAG: DUF6600 domain-containing protein [Hyphomicrobiaceae bacterium]